LFHHHTFSIARSELATTQHKLTEKIMTSTARIKDYVIVSAEGNNHDNYNYEALNHLPLPKDEIYKLCTRLESAHEEDDSHWSGDCYFTDSHWEEDRDVLKRKIYFVPRIFLNGAITDHTSLDSVCTHHGSPEHVSSFIHFLGEEVMMPLYVTGKNDFATSPIVNFVRKEMGDVEADKLVGRFDLYMDSHTFVSGVEKTDLGRMVVDAIPSDKLMPFITYVASHHNKLKKRMIANFTYTGSPAENDVGFKAIRHEGGIGFFFSPDLLKDAKQTVTSPEHLKALLAQMPEAQSATTPQPIRETIVAAHQERPPALTT
jgi:hypothetical protein